MHFSETESQCKNKGKADKAKGKNPTENATAECEKSLSRKLLNSRHFQEDATKA